MIFVDRWHFNDRAKKLHKTRKNLEKLPGAKMFDFWLSEDVQAESTFVGSREQIFRKIKMLSFKNAKMSS